jgi:hypothetical protein
MTGLEAVILAFIDVLKDGMAAALAALESEYADGVLLPAPAADAYFYYRPNLLPSYPTIIVLALPESAKDKDLAAGYDFDFALQVDVVLPADDEATCQVLLWRYWRAVKEVLTANNVIPGADVNLQAVDWNQPAWTPDGFNGPVRDIPGLFTVSTTERA